MSQITSYKDKSYWSGFSHLLKKKTTNEQLDNNFGDEFKGDMEAPSDESKRTFIKLVGASAAFAGVTGCNFRRPDQTIAPYVKRPENMIPGISTYYASGARIAGDVTGLLVETYEGRPTKIEGNPDFLYNLGSTNHYTQASILNLYDPDRLGLAKENGEETEKSQERLLEISNSIKESKGNGTVVVTEASNSPSYVKALNTLKKSAPNITLLQYEAVNEDNQKQGLLDILGKRVTTVSDFSKADIIVSLDSDFLGQEVGSVRAAKEFSARRDPDASDMNRLYVFEPRFSLTGGKADHRVRVKSSDVIFVAASLIVSLYNKKASLFGGFLTGAHLSELYKMVRNSGLQKEVIAAIVDDLIASRGKSLILAGRTQSPLVHSFVFLLNYGLGNIDKTLDIVEESSFDRLIPSTTESVEILKDKILSNDIENLVIIGGNPFYSSSLLKDEKISEKVKTISRTVHITESVNETSELCRLNIPKLHYLESWGDEEALNGDKVITQPVIMPIVENGLSSTGVLGVLSGASDGSVSEDYKLVKSLVGETEWNSVLHKGVVLSKVNRSIRSLNPTLKLSELKQKVSLIKNTSDVEIVIYPDYSVYDGRFSNNSWMQELPDPMSKLTWDNAAWVSPKTAKALGIDYKKETGISCSMLKINEKVETSVIVMPGQADGSISLFMGYGRTSVGRIGENTGFDIQSLLPNSGYVVSGAKVELLDKKYEVASTQETHDLHEREVYREGTLSHYTEEPKFAKEMVKTPPLKAIWNEKKYDTGYQWGLSIDLGKCTGCNACVTACQAENNIPIVGKEQVSKGREMHWIRSDRYFVGNDEENPEMVQQPVICLQCENAPCEQVCPVAATTHSEDGLNDMAYNRCIGTRYCSNNCPVKVRRFNYFDFHQTNPQSVKKERQHIFDLLKEPDKSLQKQFNPNVTVRMRGVMEKCTYCVQRINSGKYRAKNEDRKIIDGEIKTACSQVCPSNAIVFGDIRNKESDVSKEKSKNRNYNMLDELYLAPRTSYLANIRNPNPRLEKEKVAHHE